MNVLLLGSGGREHALAWAISASPLLDKLHCAPGNAGIAELAPCVDLDPLDFSGIAEFCRANEIGLVVVGPEAPLAAGIVDHLETQNIRAFGPKQFAARLESSKGFAKDLCAANDIPTARYRRFSDLASAKDYAAGHTLPVVVKADGLAAGKGVIVAATRAEASAALDAMFSSDMGKRGVVIEEFLEGEEASFFALCDGETALPLVAAQDHKRAFDNDQGPNTGGMGAYSPAPVMTEALIEETMQRIVAPTLAAMARAGTPYKGVLYAGLMLARDGPRLIEYNVRFGDPECQVLMLRLKSDLLTVLVAACDGVLKDMDLRWHDDAALTVVMAAKGYPGAYARGSVIRGLDEAKEEPGVEIFHAGTARDSAGNLIAAGGRVLDVCARGKSIAQARERAYKAIAHIDWPDGFYRRDIGARALKPKS